VLLDDAGQALKEFLLPPQEVPGSGLGRPHPGCPERERPHVLRHPPGVGQEPSGLRLGVGRDSFGLPPRSRHDLFGLGSLTCRQPIAAPGLQLLLPTPILCVQPGQLLGDLIQELVDLSFVVATKRQPELLLLHVHGRQALDPSGGRCVLRFVRLSHDRSTPGSSLGGG
jgi:hypothetical protein